MKNISKKTKIIISAAAIGAVLIAAPFAVHLKVLPAVVSSPKVLNYVQKVLYKEAGLKLNLSLIHI